MSQPPRTSRQVFMILYVTLWCIILVAGAGWLTAYLIGTLGDPLAGASTSSADAAAFDSVVALTEKDVVRYLGEWELHEPKLPGHFHHVGRWYQADTRNFCITCHGAIPHSRSPQVRAFLNMHNLFMACQVCHVQEHPGVKPVAFGWMSLADGALCANPDMTGDTWGEYGAKIVSLTDHDGTPKALILEEEAAFAREFRANMDQLNDSQKAKGNKLIHRRCIDPPVRCYDCHNDKDAFLPYADLGYSPDRATFLVSAEVADLVARYETFYLPNLLKANAPDNNGTGDAAP